MLKDEHKHWKVKTVTALPHSVYRVYMYKRSDERLACELRLMPLVWIGGENFGGRHSWTRWMADPPQKFPLNLHKSACQQANERWESLNFKTRSCDCFGSKGQDMDQWSMDPHFGPVSWTPYHGPGPSILFYYRRVLDRVHGHFFK